MFGPSVSVFKGRFDMKPRISGVPAINELVPYRAVSYERTDTTNRLISVTSRDIRVLLFDFGAGSRDRGVLAKWDGCKHMQTSLSCQ